MVRLLTTPEYLPSLPQELPAEAFRRIGGLITLTPERRARIGETAYLLVDGMHRRASQPNAGHVERRLKRLIRVLNKPAASRADRLCDEVRQLLESDDIGDVLSSLLMPPCPREPPMRALSPRALEGRRAALLVAAKELQRRLRIGYGDIRGPEPYSYLDAFILRLAKIFEEAGGKANPHYDDERENRQTRFVLFVAAVAGEAFRCLAPEIFAPEAASNPCTHKEFEKVRASLTLGALEERVRVLNPMTRRKRALRASKYARNRRRPKFTPWTGR